MNIIIVKGQSQYDAMRLFADELAKGFMSLGHQVIVVDAALPDSIEALIEAVTTPFNFIISFNGILHSNNDFVEFFNAHNITVISFFVDHPYYHTNRLAIANDINRCIQTFVCKSHLDAAKVIVGEQGDNMFAFLPHGGIKSDEFDFKKSDFLNRKNKVLYIASCYEKPDQAPWDGTDNHQHVLLSQAIYNGLENGLSYEESFASALDHLKIAPQKDKYRKLYLSMFKVYHYFRARNRFETINRLLDSGIEIDCYGSGDWEGLFGSHKNFSYFGSLSLSDSLKASTEYKFILNDACFFPYGSHERTFNAMLNGAVIINYESHYYEEIFDGDEGVFFTGKSLGDTAAKIKYLMGNPEEAFLVANKGYAAAQEHTWVDRAKQIVDIYNLYSC